MPDPNDYTVGWICAISTEYVAAQAFLDEKHEAPDHVASNDTNDYILGRVGKHNVVIAVLPLGEYGLSSAATVGRDMLHSFPNIRIGLMVGIAGGAPSTKHDIRLGDIVVSASGNGKGGVFQYDFGKTIQGKKFSQTGFLNQPPQILRAAVNGLMAQYESDGHKLTQAIDTAIKKNPRLRKKYTRPRADTDRLYLSNILHPEDEDANCADSCSDTYSLSMLQVRPDRTEDDDDPAIYYGLIASGNQLMKDAIIRDALAAEKDVLCFEMESAGLMNHFPCLVIRGICDYSDTHKNKEWQGFAAMAAAAYAKDLLYRISPSKVEAEKKISQVLFSIQNDVSETSKKADAIINHQQTHEQIQEHVAILSWLTSRDYAPQQEQYFGMRQPGTCQWLLESTEYQTWLEAKSEALLYSGIPGAGKTILTSIVIDDLYTRFSNDSTIGIAFIYCSYLQEDKLDELLASILRQLLHGQSSLPDSIKSLYEQCHHKKRRPSFEELSPALLSVAAMFSKVFIAVDALDECRKPCRSRLLSAIFSLQANAHVNLVATSRPISEIYKEFEECSALKSVQVQAHDEDIYLYLDSHMSSLNVSVLDRPDLREEIKQAITKVAEGMFLLARLFFHSLEDKTSVSEIKSALKELRRKTQGQSPQDYKIEALSDAYSRTMERIMNQPPGLQDLATKALSWIVCARRPLTSLELRLALAIKSDDSKLDKDNVREIDIIVSVCHGLVTMSHVDKTVRLVHYTTQEYFERMQNRWFPNAEAYITTICVAYLSFSVFDSGLCQTEDELTKRFASNPFYDYAAKRWGDHAQRASTCHQCVMNFFEKDAHVEAAGQATVPMNNWYLHFLYSRVWGDLVPKPALHLAAYFGLKDAVNALLNSGHAPDSTDIDGRTVLSWAAGNGYDAIVDLLIAQPEVDVNSQATGDYILGQTPLSIAAQNGHTAVVELLLKHTDVVPDLEAFDEYENGGRTPLSFAAERGHDAVVKLLLAHPRVNPDSSAKRIYGGRTPLSFASEKGHDAVVKLLLAHPGVNPNSGACEEYGRTPLSLAAENGHVAVVELFLAHPGVNPNLSSLRNFQGRTPLFFAAERGHEAVVKLLLAHPGVNPDLSSQGKFRGRTPLSFAAEKGHDAIVKLLLAQPGVNPDSTSEELQVLKRRTPLSSTANRGHDAVSYRKIFRGRTPLSFAAENGNDAVVKLLLAHPGVNPDSSAKGIYEGRTPLSFAAEKGHDAVVKLLLAQPGVDPDSRTQSEDSFNRTPLSFAAERGHKEVVERLLAQPGVDSHLMATRRGRREQMGTPLSLAQKNGHADIVRMINSIRRSQLA